MTNLPHLQRASSRVSKAIRQFCQNRVGQQFHADDLRAYVAIAAGPTAPGTADRVLRDMRQKKQIGYRVLNRRASLYKVDFA